MTLDDRPVLAFATPKAEEVYRFYLNQKIAVRELNNGIVQVKGYEGDWVTVE